ncbi:MAG TPA: hypothetical protein VMG58_09060 [Candidatus Sulfotelmatobacter sp.]|nr:hypothetical protein [Candidatus Sulfotelmatobacter sp.]
MAGGQRILIVEDEAITSMVIKDVVEGLGCEAVGPASRLPEALSLANDAALAGAVLDVNLNGQPVYAVADRLALRQVPFFFLTGYGAQAIPPAHSDRRVLTKPFRPPELARMLTQTFGLAPRR